MKLVFVFLIMLLVVSCTNDAQEKNIVQDQLQQKQQNKIPSKTNEIIASNLSNNNDTFAKTEPRTQVQINDEDQTNTSSYRDLSDDEDIFLTINNTLGELEIIEKNEKQNEIDLFES